MNSLDLRLQYRPLLLWGFGLLVVTSIARVFYNFFTTRMMFRRLKRQGVPMIPHSFLFGHLAVIAKLTKGFPSGFSPQYIPQLIVENWQSLFPDEKSCPGLLYLDMWPMGPPMIWTVDPSFPAQSLYDTQRNIHHPDSHKFLQPLTDNLDLFSAAGPEWRVWRSRLNPGFSPKNITSLIPLVLEEVAVFRDVLRSKAGSNGTWGPVFQLEPVATNLTFDIIVRASLDVRLHEQTRDPSNPSLMKHAMIEQLSLLIFERNITTFHQIFSPIRQWKIWRNNRVMRDFLMPHIRARLAPSSSAKNGKTIVDLAVQSYHAENPQATDNKMLPEPDALFIETVLSQLKLFIFAGHDTTAGVLSWVLHAFAEYPGQMSLVRAELDTIFGVNVDPISALRDNPHLLNSIPYTTGFIKEAFRLHPSASTIRLSVSDFAFSSSSTSADGKVESYPTNGFMLFDANLAGMRWPGAFPRPNEFLPERWLAQPGDELYPRAKNVWRGFGMGPRGCIGQELAMAELKLAVVMLAREVEIECAWDEWDLVRVHKGKKYEIEGHRCYLMDIAVPHCCEGMPVHVRLRSQ